MSNTDDSEALEPITQLDQYQLTQKIFQDVQFPDETYHLTTRYPEALLQESANANKYYGSFQRYTHQFINQNTPGGLVRWSNSSIESNQRQIVGSWLGADIKDSKIQPAKGHRKPTSAPSGLFTWSSGDSYIKARKLELQIKRGELLQDTSQPVTTAAQEEDPQGNPRSIVKINRSKESISNKLNRVVEIESNKFIHARIQVIKAHHSEEISKQIHERKRRDHEVHLLKLKLKEEEYEKELKAATIEQNKQGGFFNTLFGFNAANTNGDAAPPAAENLPSTPTNAIPPKSSKGSKSKRFSFLPGTKWSNDGKKKDKDTDGGVASETDHESKKPPVDRAEAEQEPQPEEEDDDSDFEDFTSSEPTSNPVTSDIATPEQPPASSTRAEQSPPASRVPPSSIQLPQAKPSTPITTGFPLHSPTLPLTPTTKARPPISNLSVLSSHALSPALAAMNSAILTPKALNPSTASTSHKFIPLSKPSTTTSSNLINTDLIDIFGPTLSAPPKPPQKSNISPLATEDLLEL
ncbi:uncharacterized protein CANTADRAFT_3735 [Suhomyces tanzawaensis NRRL Y-17324]|uniref:Uncharacterized protein n=1 Tax=Suhomyces tanzawaensis NRRL Y-17324 TaxID=984487 RepID=A0A1E4SQ74_9ASCO|nr:uncharacterized protein CANTADRAFT_3735 [Suhomyces tanzawaensis NRRL Y-17324]ODV81649.1 hypothetical protein CANTADRAFT_3735 [Suhomyces tanzawaensis NRRL Y-17324]